MFKARYRVEVCHATYRAPRKGYPLAISHDFSSKVSAERFARAIANRLPRETEDGCQLSWVLVSALAASDGQRVSTGAALCYLSFDPGGIVVKHHEILAGYFGAACPTCNADQSRAA